MDRKKLIQYLLLNALVSAVVTGGMLFWYDRNYRAVIQPAVIQATALPNVSSSTNAELKTDIPVKISSVVAAGILESEIVVIRFEGEGELNLTSWQMKDDSGNTYTFPQVILYQNSAVQVHTIAGTDSVIDLYWGIGEAVWNSGENASLYDSQGNLRAVYRVP
jgi:hypothetical protein